MTMFTITEDFPKSEIEFHERFSDPNACYEYLFQQKWPDGFICKRCGNKNTGLASESSIFVRNASTNTR